MLFDFSYQQFAVAGFLVFPEWTYAAPEADAPIETISIGGTTGTNVGIQGRLND